LGELFAGGGVMGHNFFGEDIRKQKRAAAQCLKRCARHIRLLGGIGGKQGAALDLR
jgi:hypothetical protein